MYKNPTKGTQAFLRLIINWQRLCVGILLFSFSIFDSPHARGATQANASLAANTLPGFRFSDQYFWFSFGNFTGNSEAQFLNPRDQSSWGISASGIFNDTAVYKAGLDIEFRYLSRKVDTTIPPPLLGTVRNHTDIDTYVFALGLRGIYPSDSALQVYASGGLAFYQSYMFVYGQQLGFPGKLEDKDSQINLYFGGGLMWQITSLSLALDVRQFMHSASFGNFSISGADLGGRSVVFSIGRSWP